MPADPRPLDQGVRLTDRFEIRRTLGRGGFGIAYLAFDLTLEELVVVKELAPQGIHRSIDGVLRFDEAAGNRLRDRFLEEASVLSKLQIKGVPPIRAIFRQNGTAYFATDYVPNAQTLQDLVRTVGPLPSQQALDIFFGLLDILESIHARRILHRDIKPSNILVVKNGEVYLIDFGAAREWHADTAITHTVLYTPGYAPPEQLSERARRGPATDLYALCATLFMMLAGMPPPSATDRAAGIQLPSLSSIRPDLEMKVVRGVEAGMALVYADRPQSAEDLRELFAMENHDVPARSIESLDATLVRLKQFSFERRSCPACKGLLAEPRALRRFACPVCQVGVIKRREIHDRLCPLCRTGVLALQKNVSPLAICPNCRVGSLIYRRKGLVSLEQFATCGSCEAQYDIKAGKMALLSDGSDYRAYDLWRKHSGRASEIWRCPDCPAQFDVLPDGRWAQVVPEPKGKHRVLYADEWARVAVGLEPGTGNAQCEACSADYFLDKEKLTLLDAPEDPNGFAVSYLGRLITVEDARWLGAGKTSPHPGYVCERCLTELDKDQQYLRLVATSNRRLSRYIDQPKILEDWHRIAQDLPTIDQEAGFADSVADAIRTGYRNGRISFDNDGLMIWKGEAARTGEQGTATLSITHHEIVFGGMLRKKRQPTDAIIGLWADEEEIHFQFSGQREKVGYRVTPVELQAHLASGDRKITLDSRDLAARITTELGL